MLVGSFPTHHESSAWPIELLSSISTRDLARQLLLLPLLLLLLLRLASPITLPSLPLPLLRPSVQKHTLPPRPTPVLHPHPPSSLTPAHLPSPAAPGSWLPSISIPTSSSTRALPLCTPSVSISAQLLPLTRALALSPAAAAQNSQQQFQLAAACCEPLAQRRSSHHHHLLHHLLHHHHHHYHRYRELSVPFSRTAEHSQAPTPHIPPIGLSLRFASIAPAGGSSCAPTSSCSAALPRHRSSGGDRHKATSQPDPGENPPPAAEHAHTPPLAHPSPIAHTHSSSATIA